MYFEINDKRVFATTGAKPFDSSKPSVIFLHGAGLDHTFWGLHSRHFGSRNYAVLVPDLPGHSNSVGPPLKSIEAMADWLNDVVTTLDIDDISIVAHSQGCLVALESASRYADRIRSVSFIASGLATPVNPALLEAAENHPEDAVAMMLSWGFAAAGNARLDRRPESSIRAGARKVMMGNIPFALATDLQACDKYRNGKQAAARITVPTQVILGGKDRMAPRKAGLELVRHLTEPDVQIIEQSGHMLPLEAPDDCLQLLESFIASNNPSR